MSNGQVSHLTDDGAQALLASSKKPVLVYFWADWCSSCKSFAPVLEEIAAEQKNKIAVAKIDIEAHNVLSTKYNVRSLPTIVMFKDGHVADTKIGVSNKGDMLKFIKDALKA